MAEYEIDDWATETTLEKIKQILEGSMKKGPLDELVKLIDDMQKGQEVSSDRAKKTLDAAKVTAESTATATDATTKGAAKEAGFRRKMVDNGKKVADEIKKQDIGKHLSEAGGMLAMPVKSMEDAFAKISGLMTAVGASVFNASKALISSMGKVGSALGGVLGGLGKLAGGLFAVGTGIVGYLLGAITSMSDTFFDLYDTGINFSSSLADGATGIGAMLQVATDANLALGDFAEYLSKNTAVAIRIGAENMAQLSKGVRDAIYPMGSFGLSIAETNEFLGDYLEQQRMTGALETLNQAQRTRAGAAYLEQITSLSMITGKRRKQIAEEMKATTQSIGLQTYLNGLSEDQRQGQLAAINTLTSVMNTIDSTGGMAKDFGDSMYFGTFAATETGQAMIKAGREQEAQMIQNIQTMVKNGEMSETQARDEIRRVVQTMNANGQARKQTALMGAALGESAGQMAALTQGAANAEAGFKRAEVGLDNAAKAAGNWDQIQNAFSLTWQKFMSGLFGGKEGNAFSEKLLEFSEVLNEMLAPGGELVTQLHAMADTLAKHVVKALEWFKGGGASKMKKWFEELPAKIKAFSDGIGAAFKAIKSFLMKDDPSGAVDEDGNPKQVMKNFGEIMSGVGSAIASAIGDVIWKHKWTILGAITGLFLAKSFISAFTSKVGTAAAGALSGAISKAPGIKNLKIPGMGGAAKATSAGPLAGATGSKKGAMDTIAKAMGKLGKGVGEAIKNLMKGVAGGLTAFANPKILLGATFFAASIAIIGAGIAGAAWILGKALPTLADGMKSFEELDGDRLIDVGLGMMSIAGGLAAMGAGSVVSGIGGLVGGAFAKLGELVGAKSPLVMLEEFSKADIDTEKAIKNADAMVAWSVAMMAGGGGAAISGLGTLIGGITGGLAKLFGGEDKDPLSQLQKFAKANIDGKKVETNAKAMAAFSDAMKDAPVIKSDVVGGIFSGIAGIFGGEVKMPWDNVKAFADADLGDSQKLLTNIQAMGAFGTAISNMPEMPEGKREGGILSDAVGFFAGDVKMPWDKIKAFSDADMGNVENMKKNAESLGHFGDMMAKVNLTSLEAWAESDVMENLTSAFGNLFGSDSPLAQIANLDRISTPLKTAGESLDTFNPKMKTLYDMLKDPNFVNGANAIKIMSNSLGDLDDQVNDWDDDELAQFKSITESMGNMTTAGVKGITEGQGQQLGELGQKLDAILASLDGGMGRLNVEQKKTTDAVVASGPHLK